MPVEDVFTITGRGTVATGRVERGVLHLNDEVEIVGIKEELSLIHIWQGGNSLRRGGGSSRGGGCILSVRILTASSE